VAFDQAVLLEPAQRLGQDLARDAADEAGELRPTAASGDVSGAWMAGGASTSAGPACRYPFDVRCAFPGWQIGESDDLAPGRVLVSDAGCWMVGQVLSSESGFRR